MQIQTITPVINTKSILFQTDLPSNCFFKSINDIIGMNEMNNPTNNIIIPKIIVNTSFIQLV